MSIIVNVLITVMMCSIQRRIPKRITSSTSVLHEISSILFVTSAYIQNGLFGFRHGDFENKDQHHIFLGSDRRRDGKND